MARLRGLLVASRVSAADRDLENLGLHGAALIQKMMDDRAAAAVTTRGGDEDSATSSNEVIRVIRVNVILGFMKCTGK